MVLGIVDPVRFLIDLLAFFAIYSMLSVSLNLEYGYLGIPNLGKVLFFAAGAFTFGGLSSRLTAYIFGASLAGLDFTKDNAAIVATTTSLLSENPITAVGLFMLLLGLGTTIGGLLGFVASYPAIKLREDYLGITLLIAGELMRYVGKYYDPIVGGTLGVAVPSTFSWIEQSSVRELVVLGILLGFAGLTWFAVEKLVRAPYGRALRAVRDHEVASEAFGKNVVQIRMTTLIVGSALAGLAGALYAFYVGAVVADDFTTGKTFIAILMVTIGGRSNNVGAMLGSFLYVTTFALIRQYKYYFTVPFDLNYLAVMIFGVVLLVMLLRRPVGILPETPSKTVDFRGILERMKAGNQKSEP
mgnify:CR=1 FL=1